MRIEMKKIKLFSAHSVVGNFSNKEVIVQWVKVDQQRSDYKSLIVDYDNLTDEEQFSSHQRLEELFTDTECRQLEECMRDHHNAEVDFHEVDLPIKARGLCVNCIGSISEIAANDFQINLWKEENYDLDFMVSGMLFYEGQIENSCYDREEGPFLYRDAELPWQTE